MGACAHFYPQRKRKTDASQDASVFGFGGSVFVPQPVLRFVLQGGEHHFPARWDRACKDCRADTSSLHARSRRWRGREMNDGQLHFPRHVNDVLFGKIDHRADNGQIGFGKDRTWDERCGCAPRAADTAAAFPARRPGGVPARLCCSRIPLPGSFSAPRRIWRRANKDFSRGALQR